MVSAHTTNTLVLPKGVILAEAEGDRRGWGLNLATLPRETLYQLQDGVSTELRTQEGCALQILSDHKDKLE